MSATFSSSETYSVVDVESVMRRVAADLLMIAGSTRAVTEDTAKAWAHDIEYLAKRGCLRMVDLTLLSNGIEIKATSFTVNTASGELTQSRPGGVMWPAVAGAQLRIVLYYTNAYDDATKEKTRDKLKISWVPSAADTSHATLKSSAGRDYVSNAFGMQRKDYE